MFGFGIQPWFEYFSVCKGRVLIPLQSRIGPEQGFPCVLFPRRENPGFITGFPGDENRFFPVRKSTQGNPCFRYRDEFAVSHVETQIVETGLRIYLYWLLADCLSRDTVFSIRLRPNVKMQLRSFIAENYRTEVISNH